MSATGVQVSPSIERLKALLPANPYFIPAAVKNSLCQKLGYTSDEEFYVDLVNIAKTFAIVPVSEFLVGVVGVTPSGNVYMGCNVEFSNLPLNFSVHAEQCLIANLVRHQEKELKLMIVNWTPCGHCRQFLSELYNSTDLQIRVLKDGGRGPQDFTSPTKSLSNLLPDMFTPKDLGVGPSERLLRPFEWTLPPNALVPTHDPMVSAGLIAVANCWAPYTRCRSAIIIQTRDGTLHAGSYMENAAYNPSLSPMQAALTSLALNRCAWTDITAVLLLELEGRISQESVSRLLISEIAHSVNLRVFRLPAELPRGSASTSA